MADIWSGIGGDIDKNEGEWLYRLGVDVRGPMPHRMLVAKLLAGDIDLDTMVAREGTEFHPLHTVQAFAPHMENARRARAARGAKQHRQRIFMVAAPVLVVLAATGLFLNHEYKKRLVDNAARERQAIAAAAAAKPPPPPAPDSLPKMGLVALVSLGSEQDVNIHGEPKPAGPKKEHTKKLGRPSRQQDEGPEEPAQEEEMVQTCKLTQQEIFGTLRNALGKLNVCVEDEKKRDTQGLLPPSIELQFVVKPNGKVTDFAIEDRHYRTGPLNNCMTKAFMTITFPSSSGANCPVTIPIKIGK